MQKFFQGGANLGYGQKRGGLCEVLHPTLARGARMTQGGGGANAPPRPPLNTALACILSCELVSHKMENIKWHRFYNSGDWPHSYKYYNLDICLTTMQPAKNSVLWLVLHFLNQSTLKVLHCLLLVVTVECYCNLQCQIAWSTAQML